MSSYSRLLYHEAQSCAQRPLASSEARSRASISAVLSLVHGPGTISTRLSAAQATSEAGGEGRGFELLKVAQALHSVGRNTLAASIRVFVSVISDVLDDLLVSRRFAGRL